MLNRELRRTGGRVLITIGDQDIDLSPSFTIFLSTRDPTVRKEYCSKLRTILYLASQTEKINKKREKSCNVSLSLLRSNLTPKGTDPYVFLTEQPGLIWVYFYWIT